MPSASASYFEADSGSSRTDNGGRDIESHAIDPVQRWPLNPQAKLRDIAIVDRVSGAMRRAFGPLRHKRNRQLVESGIVGSGKLRPAVRRGNGSDRTVPIDD